MLINTRNILLEARQNQYAIPQPNIWNINSIKAALKASVEVKSPVIIGLAQSHLEYMGNEEAAILVNFYGKKFNAEYAFI